MVNLFGTVLQALIGHRRSVDFGAGRSLARFAGMVGALLFSLQVPSTTASATTIVRTQTRGFAYSFSHIVPAFGRPVTSISATDLAFDGPDSQLGKLTGAYWEVDSQINFSYAFIGLLPAFSFEHVMLPHFTRGNDEILLPEVALSLSCVGSSNSCIASDSRTFAYQTAFQAIGDFNNLVLTPGSETGNRTEGYPRLREFLFTLALSDQIEWTGNLRLTYLYEAVVPPTGVPEPEAWILMLMGFGAAGGAMRLERRRRKTCARRSSVVSI